MPKRCSSIAGEERSGLLIARLSARFRLAAGMFLGSTIMVYMPASAQDYSDGVQTSSSIAAQSLSLKVTDSRILSDAHRPADAWAVQNPNGVAVSLRMGTETIPMDIIENVLRSDFESAGISEVAFFFEQGNSAGTGVAFHTDEYVYGPYTLVEAREAIPTDASQMKFNNGLRIER